MFNTLIGILRQLLNRFNGVKIHKKTDDYDSVIDDMPLTIVRSES